MNRWFTGLVALLGATTVFNILFSVWTSGPLWGKLLIGVGSGIVVAGLVWLAQLVIGDANHPWVAVAVALCAGGLAWLLITALWGSVHPWRSILWATAIGIAAFAGYVFIVRPFGSLVAGGIAALLAVLLAIATLSLGAIVGWAQPTGGATSSPTPSETDATPGSTMSQGTDPVPALIDLTTVTSTDVSCPKIIQSVNTSPTDSIWITVANPTADQLLFPGEAGWENVVGYKLAYSGDMTSDLTTKLYDDAVSLPFINSGQSNYTTAQAESDLDYAICRYIDEGVQIGNGINTVRDLSGQVNGNQFSVDVAAQNPWLAYAGQGPDQIATILNSVMSNTATGWQLKSNDVWYAYTAYAEKLIDLWGCLTGTSLESGMQTAANYHVVFDDMYKSGVVKRIEWNSLYQENLESLVVRPNLKGVTVDCWTGWGVNVLDGRFVSYVQECKAPTPAPQPTPGPGQSTGSTVGGGSGGNTTHTCTALWGPNKGQQVSAGSQYCTAQPPATCTALWGPNKGGQVTVGSKYCTTEGQPTPSGGAPSGTVTAPASQPSSVTATASVAPPAAPASQSAPGTQPSVAQPSAPVVNDPTNAPPSQAVGAP